MFSRSSQKNKRLKIVVYIVLLSLSGWLTAQDSTVVTKNFNFKDGVYLSFDSFQSNTPSYPIEDLVISSFINPQTSMMQVDSIYHKGAKKSIDLAEVWGISLDGIPYIRLPDSEVNKLLPAFAAIKLRGKICYFTYPVWRMKKIPVAAYNPISGRPFLRSEVTRDEMIIEEKILHFETGEILDFNYPNLLSWISEDRHLVETLEKLPPEEVNEKLFKALLIYVDRHETRIRKW